ncbi:hypothetical protein E3N88_17966 [Mikania micrantha]|uniref:Uncharacterized protein n=1 Tax=Mikania micrantha TaxID=192012 RepID=A0A5N6NUS2_9ASTR|nr:hypothetical protein E3N88_17966 [Mikania micrantha]
MRSKKNERRLPERYVDGVSTIPWQNQRFFIPNTDAIEEDVGGTRNGDTVSTQPGTLPAKRRKMDEISKRISGCKPELVLSGYTLYLRLFFSD